MVLTLLAVLTAWLVLSALATTAFSVIARGGLSEDGDRCRVDRDAVQLPQPRATIG